jgi:RHS repeat-associated protein
VTTPDGSVFQPVYNEANLLEAVRVNVRGAVAPTPFVTNIDYNAKGQRILIEYGNQTATSYGYDPLTFRLVHLTTTRAGFPANQQTAQDLFYTFDPAGNITHIQDDADLQNVVYFKNQRVEPSGDYTYDAIYRLVQARGREQLGLNGGGPLAPTPASYNDFPRAGLLQRGDGKAVGTYVETYQYDQVANFLQFIHQGANPANPGWTRAFTYGETSLLEPGKLNNRLSKTTVSGGTPLNEPYLHDLHGNMAGMPQLQTLAWDFKDQLEMTRRQAVNPGDADGVLHQGERTYYVYDATGQRARKVTESALGSVVKERFYLGAFELYREYGGGAVTLERESLHVLDGNKRVVVVETKTKDTGGAGPLPDMTTRYQFGNHLGTACLELDEGGAVISYEEYYPYGATSYQAGRTLIDVGLKRYRYIGSERDEETGLYYCGARYYAGWLGRWTSADPKGIDGGLNLYGYGRGNPVVFSDPGGKDPPAPDIPDLSVTKALQPDKATDKKPTKKTDGDAKKAGSNAGLQNLTDGNPPGGATEPGREQGEVVVAGGANAAPSSEVKGKTDVTGAGSLSVAGRRGIFLTPAGLGLEYGVMLTGSPLVPAPLSLQGTVHLGDSHFGIYGSGGFLTDPSGRPTGTIWSVNFVQGASAFDNQFNLYLNQIITNASTGQVANQSVTDATSAKFLLGIAYNPQVLEKADAAPQPAATTEQRDELTPAPAAPSAAAAEPKKVPGPNAYGGEVSGTISTGKSPILGNLKSGTATALLFYTRAFNNNQNIFGLAAGGSYESGGGGFTGFLRLGIALDRGSGKSPAASPVAGPLSIPLPFLY